MTAVVNDRIELRASRHKMLWALALVTGFVVIGRWLVDSPSVVSKALGWSTMAIFGVGVVLGVVGVLRPRTALVLSVDGVAMPASVVGSKMRVVPWSAIAGLRIFRLTTGLAPGQRMLGLVPVDASDPLWDTRLRRWSRRTSGVPVTISDQVLDLELEQIAELMQGFKPLDLEYRPRVQSFLGPR